MAHRKSWMAVGLTLLLPGLGHIYNGQTKKAVILLVLPFVFLLVCVVVVATDPYRLCFPVMTAALVGSIIFYVGSLVDAFRSAKSQSSEYQMKKYNRAYVYFGVYLAFSICFSVCRSYFRTNWFESYVVPTEGMAPTLITGDRFFADKRSDSRSKIERGEMILYRSPKDRGTIYVKRVVAVAGDKVEVFGKGVRVNGKLIETTKPEEPMNINIQNSAIEVPEGYLFLLGDNQNNSSDSRGHGPVSASSVVGKPLQIWMSYDSKNKTIRWPRLGTVLSN